MIRNTLFVAIIAIILLGCKSEEHVETPLFTKLDHAKTGIDFNNLIVENDSLNILDFEYLYNGGGVASADFNNDGLEDLFFSGNMSSNKLYINKGGFTFEDISSSSGIEAADFWCSGISIVDIDQDGFKDIYVATNTYNNSAKRTNLLFINDFGKSGKLTFTEMAKDYGLADTSYCMNSTFFDYDNDGDLDVFLINNQMQEKGNPSIYRKTKNDPNSGRLDKLYRNNGVSTNGHPIYEDVSKDAGILIEGYSLGINIVDINRDGWKDVYITNDFISADVLYINNQDGTFTDRASDYLKHLCFSAMGNDVVDINNDGLVDIIALDMQPEDNYRKKTMMGGNNYMSYINNERFNYQYQFVRNVFQLNQGKNTEDDSPIFSDVGMLAGIHATDWSWTPVVADFDGDGYRDLIVTNGFPKDITDRDFMDYRSNNAAFISKEKILEIIPEVKVHNYAYRNINGIEFEDVTSQWGFDSPSFSNGAIYTDLDNDGDLDVVINNINHIADVYENHAIEVNNFNFIEFEIVGKESNKEGLGTIIEYHSANHKGIYEHNPSRGYLSSVKQNPYLTIGSDSTISIKITWPDGFMSERKDLKSNQKIQLAYDEMSKRASISEISKSGLLVPFDGISNEIIKDKDFIDYNVEPLLLHKFSQYGPGVAVGDVDMDGFDDFYVAGSAGEKGRLYTQTKDGSFVITTPLPVDPAKEELSPLFFDFDNDGDLDIYITCGSNQFIDGDDLYSDVLLINKEGSFVDGSSGLNVPISSTSAVKASDFDKDGDLDLLVLGRVKPNNYPVAVSSYLLENNSTQDSPSFRIVNKEAAVHLDNMGLSCDAIWTDYDNDGWQDILIANEWDSPVLLRNAQGKFENVSEEAQLVGNNGWWNSITSVDLDNDGDQDYILGNFGLNSPIKASRASPVRLYSGDIDANGSIDIFPSVYFKDKDGKPKEYSYFGRTDLAKEISSIKGRFSSYDALANSDFKNMFTEDQLKVMNVLEATNLESSIIENMGDGTFNYHALPIEAQVAPVFGIVAKDVNADGLVDIMLVGNDHGTELGMGKMDALNGLVLLGDGKLNFTTLSIQESGFYVPENAKALVSIAIGDRIGYIASQNNAPLKAFVSKDYKFFNPDINDVKLVAFDRDDNILLTHEFTYGQGFLSQSTRKLNIPILASKLEVYKYNGDKRVITL